MGVLLVDEHPKSVPVDRGFTQIGGQQDVRLVQDFTANGDVAIVLALKLEAREDEVRGRRADVDADAGEADSILLGHIASRRCELCWGWDFGHCSFILICVAANGGTVPYRSRMTTTPEITRRPREADATAILPPYSVILHNDDVNDMAYV